jgi:hypothetical protein
MCGGVVYTLKRETAGVDVIRHWAGNNTDMSYTCHECSLTPTGLETKIIQTDDGPIYQIEDSYTVHWKKLDQLHGHIKEHELSGEKVNPLAYDVMASEMDYVLSLWSVKFNDRLARDIWTQWKGGIFGMCLDEDYKKARKNALEYMSGPITDEIYKSFFRLMDKGILT